jgi:hypothetical protein
VHACVKESSVYNSVDVVVQRKYMSGLDRLSSAPIADTAQLLQLLQYTATSEALTYIRSTMDRGLTDPLTIDQGILCTRIYIYVLNARAVHAWFRKLESVVGCLQ